MTGRDLSQRLTVYRPAMQTLFMSGYSNDVIAHDGVLEAGIAFLQKPVAFATLSEKVRSMLDGA